MQEDVHGDIRHLENTVVRLTPMFHVHGDIRHLENNMDQERSIACVHGDIRHLEIWVKLDCY